MPWAFERWSFKNTIKDICKTTAHEEMVALKRIFYIVSFESIWYRSIFEKYIWNDYHTSIPTLPFELCYSIYIVQSAVKMEETKEDQTNTDMQAFQRKRISEKTYNLNFFFDKIVLLRCWLFLCGLIVQKIRNEIWHIFYIF